MEMFFVYVLRSQLDGSLYIGLTADLHRRLRQHHSGHSRSTRFKRPLTLLLTETFPTREAARAREKYYKGGSGRELLRSSFGPPNAGVAK